MKAEEKEKNIARILDAVIECKKENSGSHVKLTEIAAKVGISERTLNRYFPDKDLMIYEAAVRYLRKWYNHLIEEFDSIDKNGLNSFEKLVLIVQIQFDNYKSSIGKALIFVSAYVKCLSTAIDRKIACMYYDDAIKDLIISLIVDGIKDGSIRKEVDPLDTYLLLSANFAGLIQKLVYLCGIQVPGIEKNKKFLNISSNYIEMLSRYLKR